jgi:hypothetical protein
MSAPEKLLTLSDGKAIIVFNDNCPHLEFSERELFDVSLSLARQMTVQSE